MKNENEITREWRKYPGGTVVSIQCTTFNNAANIAQALEGMLAQKTPFPYEIIIHDDASRDGTADIIRFYHLRYPNIINPILQKSNQLSQGNSPDIFTFPLCRGKYIALCEGDDYWSDDYKLAKQVVVLEENPECDLCFHGTYKLDVTTGVNHPVANYGSIPRLVTVEEVIEKRFGTIATASVMARRSVMKSYQDFMSEQEDKIVGDVYFHILASLRGGAYYLPEHMSVYRFKVPGSWSERHANHSKRRMEYLERRVRSYERMNSMTDLKFDRSFRIASQVLVMKGIKEESALISERRFFYRDNAHYLNWKQRILALSIMCLPGSISLLRRARKILSSSQVVSQ